MTILKITAKQKKLIEKLGVAYEQSGLPPAPARIMALLLVSDRTEITFDEFRNTLNLSKSATSNALNSLLASARIEYITQPGERKRYFRSTVQDWQEKVAQTMAGIGSYSILFREVLDQRTPATRDFNQKLEELIGFMDYMKQEVPKLINKWKAEKS